MKPHMSLIGRIKPTRSGNMVKLIHDYLTNNFILQGEVKDIKSSAFSIDSNNGNTGIIDVRVSLPDPVASLTCLQHAYQNNGFEILSSEYDEHTGGSLLVKKEDERYNVTIESDSSDNYIFNINTW